MKTTSRTISQIVRAHTLTYFNLLNVILAGFIILSGQYKNMLFMGIVISNSLIGIIQECKVKSLIDKQENLQPMAQSQKFRLNPWQFPTPYTL